MIGFLINAPLAILNAWIYVEWGNPINLIACMVSTAAAFFCLMLDIG